MVSSHSPPVSTAPIFDIGMKVSPVAISTNSNRMATIPNAVNNRAVRLRDCFIPGVCNNKVNRKRVPDGKYESDHATPHQDETTRNIILSIRFIRVIVAALIGIALSVSGLQMQTVFQNPLAYPYLLGVSSGAGGFVTFTSGEYCSYL